MGYNFQYPEWMQRAKTEEDASGLALGRNILQGLQVRQQQQEYADQAPLREAKLGTALANQRIQELDAEAQALNQGLIANARAGYVDVLKLRAKGLSTPGFYSSPQFNEELTKLVTDNPALAQTQALDPVLKDAEAYNAALDKSNEAQKNREYRLADAQEGAQSRENIANSKISASALTASHSAGWQQVFADIKANDPNASDLDAAAGASAAFPMAKQAQANVMSRPSSAPTQSIANLHELLNQ